MTHFLRRVFLAATLLLPLWRGDRLDAVQAKRGGVSVVDATTSALTTKKTKDVALGKVIQIGTTKFVKIAANRLMAVEPASTCDDGLSVGGSKDFDYTGGEQTFTACAGRSYKLEVWGAQGGINGTTGGYGSYSTGIINTALNGFLYINVGGQGQIPGSKPSDAEGGYNGGGKASCSRASGRHV